MTAPAPAAVIRQWARERGIVVGERGRLSPQVLTAYASSVPTSSPAVAPRLAVAGPTRQQPRGALRIPVQPTPGATGIRHRIAARPS